MPNLGVLGLALVVGLAGSAAFVGARAEVESDAAHFCRVYEALPPNEKASFWGGVRVGISAARMAPLSENESGSETSETKHLQEFLEVMGSVAPMDLHTRLQASCAKAPAIMFEAHLLTILRELLKERIAK